MRRILDFVFIGDQEYMVSTMYTIDNGLETLVFKCRNQEIIDWFDLYSRRYNSIDDAREGHNEIVNNIEKYI